MCLDWSIDNPCERCFDHRASVGGLTLRTELPVDVLDDSSTTTRQTLQVLLCRAASKILSEALRVQHQHVSCSITRGKKTANESKKSVQLPQRDTAQLAYLYPTLQASFNPIRDKENVT